MKLGLLFTCFLVLTLGGLNSVCQSNAKLLRGLDINGVRSYWNHSWAWNIFMFAAMSIALVPWRLAEAKAKAKAKSTLLASREPTPLPSEEDAPAQISLERLEVRATHTPWYLLIVPSLCDLVASGFATMAYVILHSAVLAQVAGNSILIWTALGSRIFLKRRLWSHHIIGIVLCLTALAIVTVADNLENADPGADGGDTVATVFIGVACQLLAQLIYAVQFIYEETAMQAMNASPMQVVGLEGVFGLVGMVAIATPLLYFLPGSDDTCQNCQENVFNAIYQLFQRGSGAIWIPVGIFFVSVGFYNIFGQTVTQSLSATHRTLIEALRPCAVLVLQLLLYVLPIKTEDGVKMGESVSWWTLLKLVGLLIMLASVLIYNEIIVIPHTELHKTKSSSEGDSAQKPLLSETGNNDDEI